AVSYYFPASGKGVILNDCWVIPKSAKNPVLGHLFMNHFLEMESAISSFRDVGYQTMLKDLTIDKLKAAKVAKPHEIEMAFSPPDFQKNGIPIPSWNRQQLQTIEQEFTQLTAGRHRSRSGEPGRTVTRLYAFHCSGDVLDKAIADPFDPDVGTKVYVP